MLETNGRVQYKRSQPEDEVNIAIVRYVYYKYLYHDQDAPRTSSVITADLRSRGRSVPRSSLQVQSVILIGLA